MKHLFTLLFMAITTVNVTAQNLFYPDNLEYLQLQVVLKNADNPLKGNLPSKAPMRKPTIGISGNTLYLYGQFGDLTLLLLNNGVEEYTTIVSAGANEVPLPSCAPAIYELQMSDDRYVYSCEIEIE